MARLCGGRKGRVLKDPPLPPLSSNDVEYFYRTGCQSGARSSPGPGLRFGLCNAGMRCDVPVPGPARLLTLAFIYVPIRMQPTRVAPALASAPRRFWRVTAPSGGHNTAAPCP